MTAQLMSGLEKVAVLLKSLPVKVMDKVMRHLEPRHAALVRSELAKLDKQGDLNRKLSGVLDEAVNILDGSSTKQTAAARAPKDASRSVDIRVDGKAEETPAPPPAWPDASSDPLRALAALPSDLLASAL